MNHRSVWRCLLALLATAASVFSHGRALASPDYPGALQELVNSECAPQCTLCHRDDDGGRGTVITPFGLEMMGRGELEGEVPARLALALALLENSDESPFPPSDVDRDGVSDVAELRASRDPNFAGVGYLCSATYGCGASIAPEHAPPKGGWFLALVAGAALVLAVRTSRRHFIV